VRLVTAIAMAAARVASAAPDDIVGRPLVLAPGELDAQLVVETNLSTDLFARPLSLAPDAWIGALPDLTIGVIHSDLAIDRIGAGASLCVRTQSIICPHPYHGSGLDALFSVATGSFAAAAHVRMLVRELAPFEPAATLGALVRWHRGRISITADPFLQLGLANQAHGNRTQLWLPIAASLQPMPRWAIDFYTGWNGDVAVIRDGYYVPGALGTRVRATEQFELGATFGFASVFGPQNDVKARVLFLTLGWRG
jgi:hypothetical protein